MGGVVLACCLADDAQEPAEGEVAEAINRPPVSLYSFHTTGERLLHELSLRPDAQHLGSRELVTRLPGIGFRVSRLAGQ